MQSSMYYEFINKSKKKEKKNVYLYYLKININQTYFLNNLTLAYTKAFTIIKYLNNLASLVPVAPHNVK